MAGEAIMEELMRRVKYITERAGMSRTKISGHLLLLLLLLLLFVKAC